MDNPTLILILIGAILFGLIQLVKWIHTAFSHLKKNRKIKNDIVLLRSKFAKERARGGKIKLERSITT